MGFQRIVAPKLTVLTSTKEIRRHGVITVALGSSGVSSALSEAVRVYGGTRGRGSPDSDENFSYLTSAKIKNTIEGKMYTEFDFIAIVAFSFLFGSMLAIFVLNYFG